MSLLDIIANKLRPAVHGVKHNPAYAAILSAGVNRGPTFSTVDYNGYAKEGYQLNSDVYSCINMVNRTAKGVRWHAYRKSSKSVRKFERVEDKHPLQKLLRKPNPRQSWDSFIENLLGYYQIAGNSYIARVGPGPKKPPQELYLLRPDRVNIVKGATAMNPIDGYEFREGSVIQPFKPDRVVEGEPWHTVLHFKSFNPLDYWYGMSPMQAIALQIDLNNEANKWNLSIMQNGGKVSGAFTTESELDKTTLDDTINYVRTELSGSDNAGKILVLHGGFDWKEMSLRPNDASYIEGQKLSSRRICSTFGVPPELIGDAQNKTYNNQKEARKAFYEETILPYLDFIQGELNTWLLPMYPDGEELFIAYDKDDIEALRELRDSVWERTIKAVTSGLITPNEGRTIIGFEPHGSPEAEELLLPGMNIPTGDVNPDRAAAISNYMMGGGSAADKKPKPKPSKNPDSPADPINEPVGPEE